MKTAMSELVSGHPLLAGLPGDAVAHVAGCARNEAFGPGSLLLAEGDPAGTFYLLRRGRVAIEVYAPGRGSISVETVEPGAIVGWSWLFPPYRSHFDARAIDAVGVIAVDGTCLRAKAEIDPVFGYALMTRMAGLLLERLQATRVRLLDLYGTGDVR